MTLTQVLCAVPILLAACFAVCMALAARVQRTRQGALEQYMDAGGDHYRSLMLGVLAENAARWEAGEGAA